MITFPFVGIDCMIFVPVFLVEVVGVYVWVYETLIMKLTLKSGSDPNSRNIDHGYCHCFSYKNFWSFINTSFSECWFSGQHFGIAWMLSCMWCM